MRTDVDILADLDAMLEQQRNVRLRIRELKDKLTTQETELLGVKIVIDNLREELRRNKNASNEEM